MTPSGSGTSARLRNRVCNINLASFADSWPNSRPGCSVSLTEWAGCSGDSGGDIIGGARSVGAGLPDVHSDILIARIVIYWMTKRVEWRILSGDAQRRCQQRPASGSDGENKKHITVIPSVQIGCYQMVEKIKTSE